MERGEFPTDLPLDNDFLPTIHPDDISLFIELSQFSLGKGTFAHYLTNSEVVSWKHCTKTLVSVGKAVFGHQKL